MRVCALGLVPDVYQIEPRKYLNKLAKCNINQCRSIEFETEKKEHRNEMNIHHEERRACWCHRYRYLVIRWKYVTNKYTYRKYQNKMKVHSAQNVTLNSRKALKSSIHYVYVCVCVWNVYGCDWYLLVPYTHPTRNYVCIIENQFFHVFPHLNYMQKMCAQHP